MSGYKTLTDANLVALLKQQDEVAFTEIYNRYWKLLYAHVFKMLRNGDDTEDIIQIIFSNLWQKSAELKNDRNIAGWLYTAARHRVFDLIEKNKVRNDYLKEIAVYASQADSSSLEAIDEKRLLSIIEKEIQSLPPKMREVFELSRKAHLSHREIAEQLNISEQTVKKQVQNALKLIKPKLNEAGICITVFLLFR